MTTTTLMPETKWQARVRNDLRAQSIYAKRPNIDRRLEDMRLAKQIGEVWA